MAIYENKSFKKGIFFVLLAWIFFTFMIALSKLIADKTSVIMILLFQNGISLMIILPSFFKSKPTIKTSKFKLLFLRAIAGYLSYAFIFLAAERISLVNTILLSNSAPFFIPLIIWIWRKVTLNYKLWLGILIGFIGIGLILKPDLQLFNLGTIFALAAGLCLAISMIVQRRLIKTEPVSLILFSYFLISTIISLPIALYYGPIPEKDILLSLIAIGILSSIGQILFQCAFQYGKPSILSPFNYIAVVYALLFEWLIWKRYPDLLSIFGILMVALGGILSIMHDEFENGNIAK